MDYVYAAILGIIQGLTEFLPVSSTGHLALAQELFGLDQARFGLQFDAAIHLGTAAAVVGFFRKDLWRVVTGFRRPQERKLGYSLVIASIPAGLAGLAFEDLVDGPLRDPAVIATALAIGAVVFLVVERVAKARKDVRDATILDALIIGLAQAFALIPGVSRSGSTTVVGMLLGLKRAEAARFAFLLSVPIVVAAGGKKFLDTLGEPGGGAIGITLVGLAASAIVGYFTIRYLLRFLQQNRLDAFAYYRLVLAGVIVLTLL
ncbi:MAG: undecaprenyl-diphosphatase UppP [bacterium]|nr:undecaprenyl-diphosphatase UppP [bacterium]